MKEPKNLPKCKHGKIVATGCKECAYETRAIQLKVSDLVYEFWENHGKRDLTHLMVRAYKMGMKHED